MGRRRVRGRARRNHHRRGRTGADRPDDLVAGQGWRGDYRKPRLPEDQHVEAAPGKLSGTEENIPLAGGWRSKGLANYQKRLRKHSAFPSGSHGDWWPRGDGLLAEAPRVDARQVQSLAERLPHERDTYARLQGRFGVTNLPRGT